MFMSGSSTPSNLVGTTENHIYQYEMPINFDCLDDSAKTQVLTMGCGRSFSPLENKESEIKITTEGQDIQYFVTTMTHSVNDMFKYGFITDLPLKGKNTNTYSAYNF